MNEITLPTNTSLSLKSPRLQLAWDSVSLGALKKCFRYYDLTILQGWTPRRTSVHLLFGLWYHGALEGYDHARSKGLSHEDALDRAVDFVLRVTWDSKLNRPWISDDPNKNRLTLLRTVVWYLDQFGENDTCKTIQLANGRPAVELSFRYDTGFRTANNEPLLHAGHLDRLVNFQDQTYILDRKTTKYTLTPEFFDGFSPDNQMSGYATAGKVVYNLQTSGIIIDAAQIAVTFSRFLRGFANRKDSQLDEWLKDFGEWTKLAEHFAARDYWPMNESSCDKYGGCALRGICAKAPSIRDEWLKASFVKRVWDPLVARGDI